MAWKGYISISYLFINVKIDVPLWQLTKLSIHITLKSSFNNSTTQCDPTYLKVKKKNEIFWKPKSNSGFILFYFLTLRRLWLKQFFRFPTFLVQIGSENYQELIFIITFLITDDVLPCYEISINLNKRCLSCG